MAAESLNFPEQDAAKLEPYLPPPSTTSAAPASQTGPSSSLPFVTLTFATSLDSSLSLAPGTQTVLSGPQSKAMTHFLRSRHDAICVGVGTAIADDPGLNCRLAAPAASPQQHTGIHQPRPVVVDPGARWDFTEDSKVLRLVRTRGGRAPFVITAVRDPPAARAALLERHGGKYIVLDGAAGAGAGAGGGEVEGRRRFGWEDILRAVAREGLRSIMVEGGAQIINSLLDAPDRALVDSVIVTIAPTWLGEGGVVVSPSRVVDEAGRPRPAARLRDVLWHPLGDDVVLCGRLLQ
ncbi:Riboflavin biosynthesis protein [Pleurostoma richardsiae]|uniref:2,5-diamino-6-ribosylamino-4(3H)-pyrimidinone 5'-phosphate reductase n=1 Tax=Pleurostoma richardsiae TaxID=41990 RepID=A0AA38VLK2_9PEZI|nr:Riboflavin biosynthesis protein [Pleurostoma richardsiae]